MKTGLTYFCNYQYLEKERTVYQTSYIENQIGHIPVQGRLESACYI